MQLQELNTTDAIVFEREIQNRIDSCRENFSLFIVDMDAISKLLVRSGHAYSVMFLRGAARRLEAVCRENDALLRIGDHTFGLVMSGVTAQIYQRLAVEKIIRLYEQAIRDVDSPYQAEIRVGIASFPDHASNAEELIHRARIALEAANTTRKQYFIYSADGAATLSMKWNLQEELGAAIENKALELHYQPKVSATTGQVVGAESLLRWTNAKHGEVPPSVFIPVACEIGMIGELTRFILTTALQHVSEWPRADVPYSLSVNLEADSIQDPGIADIVSSSLSIFGSEQCQLDLEITESALVEDSHSNFDCLRRLRELGVGISIDDFGTGYSSLSYFKNIPATELKIDRSFVENMFNSPQDKNIVEAIIWLAHRFGLSVVAEGVETAQQREVLTEMKCDTLQGFLFSRACPHDEFCRWLMLPENSW